MSIREASEEVFVSRAIRSARSSAKVRRALLTGARSGTTPALGDYIEALEALLAANEELAASKRRTMLSLYEELQGQGYPGSYSSVRRYAGKWRGERASLSEVYIPLSFGRGEAFQFDWQRGDRNRRHGDAGRCCAFPALPQPYEFPCGLPVAAYGDAFGRPRQGA